MDRGIRWDWPGVRDLLKVDKSRGQPSVSPTVNKLLGKGLRGSNQEFFRGNSQLIAMLNLPSTFEGCLAGNVCGRSTTPAFGSTATTV